MATLGKTIKVFMSPRPLFKSHATTYFECEIPEELEEKIWKYVNKLVSKYKCNCERCRYERKEMTQEEEQKINEDWCKYRNTEFNQQKQ